METKEGNLNMRNQDKGTCSKVTITLLKNTLLRTYASPCPFLPFSVTARHILLITWTVENHLIFTQENKKIRRLKDRQLNRERTTLGQKIKDQRLIRWIKRQNLLQ